jgi:hypothetical protein
MGFGSWSVMIVLLNGMIAENAFGVIVVIELDLPPLRV